MTGTRRQDHFSVQFGTFSNRQHDIHTARLRPRPGLCGCCDALAFFCEHGLRRYRAKEGQNANATGGTYTHSHPLPHTLSTGRFNVRHTRGLFFIKTNKKNFLKHFVREIPSLPHKGEARQEGSGVCVCVRVWFGHGTARLASRGHGHAPDSISRRGHGVERGGGGCRV